ncbi:ferredoxin family protein [Streptomyces sp. KL116D]|uniref:4Fe-4S dicluster domain-containing protein n=1 Tax=Streptomyces sp. KL116D TaxID=3045152 RepID=UPI0035584AB7
MRILCDVIMIDRKSAAEVGIQAWVVRHVFWKSEAGQKMLHDLFSDVRMLAQDIGLMNKVSRPLWKALRIDGRPAGFRGEPPIPHADSSARGPPHHPFPERRPARQSAVRRHPILLRRRLLSVLACPVNCIHAPGEPGFGTADMLYVDPRTCVDCGACTTACPVDASSHTALSEPELPPPGTQRLLLQRESARRPRAHARRAPAAHLAAGRAVRGRRRRRSAGLFAADELLRHPGVRVTVFDRLRPRTVSRGPASHRTTRTPSRSPNSSAIESQPGFSYRLGVRIGTDLTHPTSCARTTR